MRDAVPHGLSWVIFDLDDTLYLEREYVRSGFEHLNSFAEVEFGLQGFGKTCWNLFLDGTRNETFSLAAEALGLKISRKQLDALIDAYRSHIPSISLQDGCRQILECMKNAYGLGVLTGGNLTSQVRKIRALDLEPIFEHVVLTGAWGPEFDKPHIRGWREMETQIGHPQGQIVYVADNPVKDIPSSQACGWKFIRVRLPGSLHESVPTPSGFLELTSLAHLDRAFADIS